MNDRIEELIVSYLHRGSSPEQEKELFEACRTNPDVANLLRQHISLSLKLRQLRDNTQVPEETHAVLMRRINEIQIEKTSTQKERRSWFPFFDRGRQPVWRPVGTAILATAAFMLALFFFTRPAKEDPGGSATATVSSPDTILFTRIDTVYQTRTIRRPVYIVRYEKPHQDTKGLKDNALSGDSPSELATTPVTPRGDSHAEPVVSKDVKPESIPAIAESRLPEQSSYMQQYTNMVTSLEKIRLSSGDRIRE